MNLRERWAALSVRERALIVAAAVVAVVAAIRYAPVSPFGALSGGGEDERWMDAQKVRSYQKILARKDSVVAQRKQLESRFAADQKRLIPGESATQVGAELQGMLRSMASDTGLNVLSSQILKEEEVGKFRRVGVRLTLSGSLDGVTTLLTSIETGQTDLAVSLLEINRKLGASRRPVTTRVPRPTAQIAPLTATIEVKTFMREAPENS